MERKVNQITAFDSSTSAMETKFEEKKILIIHMTGHSKNYFQIKCFLHLF